MDIILNIPKSFPTDSLKNVEELKNGKGCGKLIKDEDDFCSLECLENYANEFLKKNN